MPLYETAALGVTPTFLNLDMEEYRDLALTVDVFTAVLAEEEFLGLELAEAMPIGTTATGRTAQVLHTFYRLGDGSYLAFFEAPDMPFEFKPQHDFDLHIALGQYRSDTSTHLVCRTHGDS